MARSAYIYVVMDDRVGGVGVMAVFTVKWEALKWLGAYNKRTTERWYEPVLYRYPDCGWNMYSGVVSKPTRIEL